MQGTRRQLDHGARRPHRMPNPLPCSSSAPLAPLVEAIKAGVNNYCIKPFTVESLGEKITQTLAKLGVG